MKETAPREAGRRLGRPRSFDRDEALDRAMRLFWRHGYEGTSLADLTSAMGITPPSLYAAFGDKKRLFREAVRRYMDGLLTAEETAVAAAAPEPATARDYARTLLRNAALRYTGFDTPPGCLVASAAISCSGAAADVQAGLAAIRLDAELTLRQRIARAIAEGELPPGTDADDLAAHVMAVVQGMSTLARDGATRDKLLRLADTAMVGWPARRRA